MIRREEKGKYFLIRQDDHATLAGELARRIGAPPFESVLSVNAVEGAKALTAVTMHDAGWPIHDNVPTLNNRLVPRDVFESKHDMAMAVWTASGDRASAVDPYAGLLVSLHSLSLSAFALAEVMVHVSRKAVAYTRERFDLNRFQHNEIERQTELVSSGGRVTQETRLWDVAAGRTVSMRSKEEAHDYRYFPEPDLPPVVVDADRIQRIQVTMPELPGARRRRFVEAYALPEYDAAQLTQSRAGADYFEAAVRAGAPPKAASNWIMGELARKLKEQNQDLGSSPLGPERLAGLIALVDRGAISGSMAKDVFEKMFGTNQSADAIVVAEGLAQIDDESQIVGLIADVLARNADAVTQYRAGKASTFGFLVGQVMKAAGGKANPRRVNEMLKRALEA